LCLMMLMISHSCWVLRLSRETSVHMMVDPCSAVSSKRSSSGLIFASPWTRSAMISSAPAAFSSRIWRFRSCPFSSARLHLAKPYIIQYERHQIQRHRTIFSADFQRGKTPKRYRGMKRGQSLAGLTYHFRLFSSPFWLNYLLKQRFSRPSKALPWQIRTWVRRIRCSLSAAKPD